MYELKWDWEVMLDALAAWILSKVPSISGEWVEKRLGLTRAQRLNYLLLVEGLDYHDRQRLIGGKSVVFPRYVGGMEEVEAIAEAKSGRLG